MDYHCTKCERKKRGDSRFPEAFGWLWRDTGPLLRKQKRTALPVQSVGAGAIDALPYFWDKTRIMEEDTGRAGAGAVGVAEEEPFPSQLHLHFLWVEEVPCWARSDLILGSEKLWNCSHRRQIRGQGLDTHPHTRTQTRLSWLSQWKTYTHPHSWLFPTGSTAGWDKQALPVCARAHSQSKANQTPMFCPLHHYRRHSADITAHLLIATRPYLCLSVCLHPKHPIQHHPHHRQPKLGHVSPCGSQLFLLKLTTNWNTLGLNCLFFPFTHHVDRRANISVGLANLL